MHTLYLRLDHDTLMTLQLRWFIRKNVYLFFVMPDGFQFCWKSCLHCCVGCCCFIVYGAVGLLYPKVANGWGSGDSTANSCWSWGAVLSLWKYFGILNRFYSGKVIPFVDGADTYKLSFKHYDSCYTALCSEWVDPDQDRRLWSFWHSRGLLTCQFIFIRCLIYSCSLH